MTHKSVLIFEMELLKLLRICHFNEGVIRFYYNILCRGIVSPPRGSSYVENFVWYQLHYTPCLALLCSLGD